MIAAQNQLGGRRVEEVVIFGDGQHHSTLKQLLEKELSLTVKLVDPFESRRVGRRARRASPSIPARSRRSWACCSTKRPANRARSSIFCTRARSPRRPNQRRTYDHGGAAVAAAIVLLGFGYMQWRLWTLDSQIKPLRKSEPHQAEKLAEESTQADRKTPSRSTRSPRAT